MKEYDSVEIIVEKERYTKHGVHKGMQGWICFEKCVEGYSLVNFPCYGDHPDIATIAVKDTDLIVIAEGDDWVNDRIRAEHEGKKQHLYGDKQ